MPMHEQLSASCGRFITCERLMRTMIDEKKHQQQAVTVLNSVLDHFGPVTSLWKDGKRAYFGALLSPDVLRHIIVAHIRAVLKSIPNHFPTRA